MIIREIMTDDPITVETDSTLYDVAKLMEENDIGCVPIVEDDRVVGMLTDRDLVVKAVSKGLDLASHYVDDVMIREVKTVDVETEAQIAADIMIENKIRRLPVTENDRLIGILTLGDLAISTHDSDACGHVLEEVCSP